MSEDPAKNLATQSDDFSFHDLVSCECCGLVQQLGTVAKGQRASCPRCHSPIRSHHGHRQWCLSFASSALMLYPFAIFLPILHIEKLGHQQDASIWSGCVQLLSGGYWFTGFIVVCCSIILPLCKLSGLLLLSRSSFLQKHHQARTYRLIELSGRWGMLDVMLVAILVASVKLGNAVQMQAGLGLSIFCLCVVLSLAASAAFNPHMLWKQEHE